MKKKTGLKPELLSSKAAQWMDALAHTQHKPKPKAEWPRQGQKSQTIKPNR